MAGDLTLRVNGQDRAVRADTRHTLLEVLRDQLGLTGAKRGCNQGVCGACTVLADGEPVRACLSLAVASGGREITTIEGIGTPRHPAPIQRAIIESGAIQCGFCTSGLLLSAHALLQRNSRPSSTEVRRALAGNLCRCSGYVKIVEAVCGAAAGEAR